MRDFAVWHGASAIVMWHPGAAVLRVTAFDDEVARWRRQVFRDMTGAVLALILATGFAVLVKRWTR